LKDLVIKDRMTLHLQESTWLVEVGIKVADHFVIANVSFEQLEKWLASIKEQIITVATDIHVTSHDNGSIGCGAACKHCGGNSLSCGCR